jgi:hypothetical protein
MTEKRTVTIRVKQEITYEVTFTTSLRPHDAAKEALGWIRDRSPAQRDEATIHTLWTAESESGEIVRG